MAAIPPFDPEHDRELHRFVIEKPLITQPQARLEVAGVIDFQFGCHAEVFHLRGQLANLARRVAELVFTEAHAARVERGHPPTKLHQGGALLERHREPDAGGQLNEDRTALGDQVHRARGDGQIGGGPMLGVA